MCHEYQPFDKEIDFREQLRRLKQEKGQFRSYLTKFQILHNQITDMSVKDTILNFQNGLLANTATEVCLRRPKTLAEATDIAFAFEQRYKFNQQSEQSSNERSATRVQAPQSNGTRFNRPEHRANTNVTTPSMEEKGIECYRCHKMGHYAAKCPTKASPIVAPFPHKGAPRRLNALLAAKSGPRAMKTQAPITVKGTLNGHLVDCVIDTGASSTIIARDLAERLKLRVHEAGTRIITATKGPSAPVSTTGKVAIEIHGSIVQMPLLVHDLPSQYQCLVGPDWLNISRCIVDTVEQRLIFKPREICLRTEQEDTSSETVNCFIAELELTDESTEKADIDAEQTWDDGIAVDVNKAQLLDLQPEQETEVRNFLSTHIERFANSYSSLGCCTVSEHEIKPDVDKPIYLHPYRKSFSERQAIQEEVQKMLAANVIRPSKSPWSSPVVMIRKKDGSVRFCVNYKAINAVTPQDQFPLPRIDDILDRLAGSVWFSCLDLKSGYWQVKVHENSIPITAFTTPDGHFEFLRLPFSLRNAPADFRSIMQQVLGDLPYVQIYIDDITVHSTTFDDHMMHLGEVMRRLKEANLKVNYDKCVWFRKQVAILGHVVGSHTVKMNPAKVSTIDNMNPPKNIKQIQQFLGLCGYYRKFVQDFSKIAAPMFNLLRKDVQWEWTKECQLAFAELKT